MRLFHAERAAITEVSLDGLSILRGPLADLRETWQRQRGRRDHRGLHRPPVRLCVGATDIPAFQERVVVGVQTAAGRHEGRPLGEICERGLPRHAGSKPPRGWNPNWI